MKRFAIITSAVALMAFSSMASAKELIGDVTTAFKLLGANHKVVVNAYDDPKVKGVTCYVSQAKKGGISGSLGLATDPSEASIACRQVGPVSFVGKLPKQEVVFKESTSILFKNTKVVRMTDSDRKTLIYLVYSDKLIDGSPKNNITAVPVNMAIPME